MIISDFNRLPLSDQLKIVKKVKAEKTLLEKVKMLTDVNPIVKIWNDKSITLVSNHGILN
jgi:hypothetical protein